MKLFGRSGGYWLFWISFVYLVVGFVNIFLYNFVESAYVQMVYILILSLPLVIKPFANYLNMRTIWEK
jgi:hypothetical protein